MRDAIADALGSKKFLAFLATMLVVIGNKIVGHWGYELDATQVSLLVGTAAAYILGQGIADHGKSAAEINQQTVAMQMVPVKPNAPGSLPGFVRLGLMFALATIAAIAIGCGASSRQKTIQTTFAAVDTAEKGFVAFDAQHELDIVSKAASHDDGVKQLNEYQRKRLEVDKAFVAAYKAIAAAATLDTDPSMNGALEAAAILAQELAVLGVKPGAGK